jgi:hypothetical protein
LCISYVDAGTDRDEDLNPGVDVADIVQVVDVNDADASKDRNGRGRRRKLWEQWFFRCECERCSRDKLRASSFSI